MSDALFDRIRAYLMDHWDPIGIGPSSSPSGPEDEYDGYARDLAGMVERGCLLADFSTYVAGAEDHMGVDRSPVRIARVASFLAGLESR